MGSNTHEPAGNPSDFGSSFPRAVLALEDAVQDLLSDGWEECRRCRAYEMAIALAQVAKVQVWGKTEGILRAMASLLELSFPQVLAIRQAVREKLLELLGLLKTCPMFRTA